MENKFIWIVVIVVVIIGVFLLFGNRQPASQPGIVSSPEVITEPKTMEVQLNAVSKDQIDQSGKATLEENNGKVIITLEINQVDTLNNQPAHIHMGSCPGVGEVLFPLTNVVDGKSVTEISTTIDQLRAQSPLAINVHKSAQEISVYTTCGNLP